MTAIPVQAFQSSSGSFVPALLHLEGGRCLGLEERRLGDSGLFMAPGFIDSHAHVYPGATDLGIPADRVGLSTGVHLVVDAGSAGSTSFPVSGSMCSPPFRPRCAPF